MGSRGYLRLENAVVLDSDNREVNPLHLSLFQDGDLCIWSDDSTQLSVEEVEALEHDDEGLGYTDDGEPRVIAQYVATAATIKERLEVMGFNLRWARREFSLGQDERASQRALYANAPYDASSGDAEGA